MFRKSLRMVPVYHESIYFVACEVGYLFYAKLVLLNVTVVINSRLS